MHEYHKKILALTAIAGVTSLVAGMLFWLSPALAAEAAQSSHITLSPETVKGGFLAAALATGMSALGAGYAVASVGSAAIAALAEKPELLGRVLIMVGLAEGIAIYGLIISILILNQVI